MKRNLSLVSSLLGTVLVLIASLTSGCRAAYYQKPDEVAIRRPGFRLLSAPVPLNEEGERDWEYAWLSVAAYNETPDGRQRRLARVAKGPADEGGKCQEAETILVGRHWKRWESFLSTEAAAKIQEAHLRVEVWERTDPPTVVVAFGGTVFNNDKDWVSNLRWFIPFHEDEYTTAVKYFTPEFVREFGRRFGGTIGMTLIATGHSLGGGLAQQFAYALPTDSPIPRVTRVYAFDPSPVTGYFGVATDVREKNRTGLRTDRIYERGEILALLRSFMSLFVPPSAADPEIKGVRYALYQGNPIADHSIDRMACLLSLALGHQELRKDQRQGVFSR